MANKNYLNVLFFYILFITNTSAQMNNLLPNPGFEGLSKDFSQGKENSIFEFTKEWKLVGGDALPAKYRYTDRSYSKFIDSIASQSHNMGNSYISISFECYQSSDSDNPFYRGYIQAKLKVPLEKGVKYKAGFSTVLYPNFANVAVNGMGLLFTNEPIEKLENSIIILKPQVVSNNVIMPQNQFSLVEGEFTAESNYQYVIIGNFFGNDKISRVPIIEKDKSDDELNNFLSRITQTVRYAIDNAFLYKL